MKLRTEMIALSTLALIATAGCTPGAREDVGKAGDNVASATEKSAEGTAEAVGKAGTAVKEGAKEAAHDTAVVADKAGDAVKQGAENVGEAVGGAAKNVKEATKGVAEVTTLTPKVKNALVVSKQIDASTLNVDTNATAKTVTIKGTQPTEAKKKLVTDVATKALQDAQSDFKVKNEVTVSK